jgi:thiamine biosynthesis lipoprotein
MDVHRRLAPLLAGAAALVAPSADTAVHRFQCLQALGTSLDLVAVGGERSDAEIALAAAEAEIARLDPILSGWREDSELAALNRGEGTVSPDLSHVLAAAARWRAATDGGFDAGRGGVWSFDGIAKGYVVDRALLAAREAAPSLRGLLVDIGGDLAVWGEGPGGRWGVGVADPLRPEDNAAPAAVLRLTDVAVATSGAGPRGTVHLGRDGSPAGEVASATAVAGCAMDADALSTALMAVPPREGMRLVERTAGAEARLALADGRVMTSSGWGRLATDAPPPRLIRVADAPAGAPWPAGFQVTVEYELLKPDRPPVYRPYLSIWVTDAGGRLVRQVALQGDDPNYIDQNYVWWRRYGRTLPKVQAISRPTRPAGRYSAVWDGKDQAGRPVAQGRYTVHIETVREHGGHSYQAVALDLMGEPVQGQGMAGEELGASRVRYGRR